MSMTIHRYLKGQHTAHKSLKRTIEIYRNVFYRSFFKTSFLSNPTVDFLILYNCVKSPTPFLIYIYFEHGLLSFQINRVFFFGIFDLMCVNFNSIETNKFIIALPFFQHRFDMIIKYRKPQKPINFESNEREKNDKHYSEN